MDLHEELKQSGWRQGSVLTEADFTVLLSGISATHHRHVGIVLSHSCDLLNPVLKKFPKVEIIVGKIILSPDSRYQKRRNPRILHIPIAVDRSEKWVELRVEDRMFVDREQFRDHAADPDRRLLDIDRQDMSLWISGAYSRSALPDSFQQCLGENRNDFEGIYQRLNRYISDILISIYPDGELKTGESYTATVVLVVENDAEVEATDVVEGCNQLQKALEKSSIDATVTALAESEASIKLLKSCYRLTTDAWSDIGHGDPLTGYRRY